MFLQAILALSFWFAFMVLLDFPTSVGKNSGCALQKTNARLSACAVSGGLYFGSVSGREMTFERLEINRSRQDGSTINPSKL